MGSMRTYVSAYWVNGVRYNVMDEDIRVNIKITAAVLDYPEGKGNPINKIDTHALRAGYVDRQIQKMER